MNPKVFIIHASEDKKRFVLDFATKLCSKGIDAWIDEWEMYPGDSLVDKIFEEGIKNANAIVVILSKNSIDKPWVREELNASMVKKINGKSKLIPVIIEECKVPECLKSIVWEKIEDLKNYDAELERIVNSIYGQRDKPPIGTPPSYTQTIVDILPELTRLDSIIMKLSCEKAIEIGHPHIETESILSQAKSLDIHHEDFFESLEVLNKKGYVKAAKDLNGNVSLFSVTIFGFDKYARVCINDYDSIIKSVALQIVNLNNVNNKSIATSLHHPQMVIDHILNVLEHKDLINIEKESGGRISIFEVSPELKRMMRENQDES